MIIIIIINIIIMIVLISQIIIIGSIMRIIIKTRTTIMINKKIEYSKDARTVQCSTYPRGFA